jgi:hypothetical protein
VDASICLAVKMLASAGIVVEPVGCGVFTVEKEAKELQEARNERTL